MQWFRTIKFPVRDADGRIVAVGGLSIDITERKHAEDALQDYAQRLQALSQHLLDIQEQERRRLSRELHDEVGQSLTGLRLTLERGERLGEAGCAKRSAKRGGCCATSPARSAISL